MMKYLSLLLTLPLSIACAADTTSGEEAALLCEDVHTHTYGCGLVLPENECESATGDELLRFEELLSLDCDEMSEALATASNSLPVQAGGVLTRGTLTVGSNTMDGATMYVNLNPNRDTVRFIRGQDVPWPRTRTDDFRVSCAAPSTSLYTQGDAVYYRTFNNWNYSTTDPLRVRCRINLGGMIFGMPSQRIHVELIGYR